jgi:two-component system response regulator FixJ
MGSNNQINQIVHIIDDDLSVCEFMCSLFESVDYPTRAYQSASLFLQQYDQQQSGCLFIDARLPNMSGFELLEQLNTQKSRLPVVMMTSEGDVPMAIRAMKLGALDFLLKPLNDQCLLEIVQKQMNNAVNTCHVDELKERINSLSDRELQIMNLICDGYLNKEIAYELTISMSTVEAHRANIMRKMQAKNAAQLIKLFLQAQE